MRAADGQRGDADAEAVPDLHLHVGQPLGELVQSLARWDLDEEIELVVAFGQPAQIGDLRQRSDERDLGALLHAPLLAAGERTFGVDSHSSNLKSEMTSSAQRRRASAAAVPYGSTVSMCS